MRDIETIDSELGWWRLFPCGSGAGGPLPSIDVADSLLDERRMLTGDLNYRQMISSDYGGPAAVFVL